MAQNILGHWINLKILQVYNLQSSFILSICHIQTADPAEAPQQLIYPQFLISLLLKT